QVLDRFSDQKRFRDEVWKRRHLMVYSNGKNPKPQKIILWNRSLNTSSFVMLISKDILSFRAGFTARTIYSAPSHCNILRMQQVTVGSSPRSLWIKALMPSPHPRLADL